MSRTPLAVDVYARFLMNLFDEKSIIGVPTVWQSFFGRPEHQSRTIYNPDSKVVEIDIMRGNEKIAALIHRGTNAQGLGDLAPKNSAQKYGTFSRVYPLAEEESSITGDQILSRMAGENPYEGRTRVDRMRLLALDHYQEHIRKLVRLFEYLAGESLMTGKMPAILGTTNADFIYDFRRSSTHIIVPSVKWNATGATILADIDAACLKIRQNGHVTPNVLFMAGDVMNAFMADVTVQTLADNRRFELIEVGMNNPVPENLMPLVTAGAIPRGRLRTPKGFETWLFTYVDLYTNSAGAPTPYLPNGTALLAYYGARCDRYFGPPELLPVDPQTAQWFQYLFGFNQLMPPMVPNVKGVNAAIAPEMFYPSAYKVSDKVVSFKTQSAPIFATTQTDAFVTFTGLT